MSSLARRLSFSKDGPEEEVAVELFQNDGTALNLSGPTVEQGEKLRTIVKPISECPTTAVCLFSDRAQVERTLRIPANKEKKKEEEKEEKEEKEAEGSENKKEKEKEGGEKELSSLLVIISDLPQNSDNSSIRVSQLRGSSKILEVAVENVQKEVLLGEEPEAGGEGQALKDAATVAREKAEREAKKKELLLKLDEEERLVREEQARLKKEREFVEQYASQQTNPAAEVTTSIEQAIEFLSFYGEQNARFDQEDEEHARRLELIATRRRQLVEVRMVKSVYLLLEDADGELEFSLSYLMPNARWEPIYDLRVQSSQTDAVEVTYHSVITNSTGEHWQDVELSLSTAAPQVGGAPPPLHTSLVRFVLRSYPSRASMNFNPLFSSAAPAAAPKMRKRASSVEDFRGEEVAQAQARKAGTSTTFRIPRLATIHSDSQPHKVTVSITELAGSSSHTIIPKLSEHAYLRVKATNRCDFPFLQGKANVYMDETFVASSELKTTHPGEEFSLYLGSDPTVLVEFKESFLTSQRGLVSKTSSTRHLHEIRVKNTKRIPILCQIYEALPKSQEDKIKVVVARPVILEQEREGACVLIPQNNSIRWAPTVAPGQVFTAEFEFTIECPAGRQVGFVH